MGKPGHIAARKLLPPVIEVCGMHGAGCGTVYVHLNLPETKGISLAAIQELLKDEHASGEKPAGKD